MATCKYCLHFEACKQWYTALPDKYYDGCEHFKPRSRFVEFLCKPMDTVYFIECRTDGNHKIKSGFAFSVEYSVCYNPLVTIRYDGDTTESTRHYLGLKAFLTREEAEAALAKMGGAKDG